MNVIAAVDGNWGIGYKGSLLVHIPDDLHRFRTMTMGGILLLGRKTLESFPNGKPLPGRRNLILSRQKDFRVQEGEVFCNLKDMAAAVSEEESEHVFVVGGESVYRQLLPYCRYAYLTRIRKSFPADTYFPDIASFPQWQLLEESPVYYWKDMAYTYQKYENRDAKS